MVSQLKQIFVAIFAFILGSQHPLPLRTVKTELAGEGRIKEDRGTVREEWEEEGQEKGE